MKHEEHIKRDPALLMVGMAVESSLEVASQLSTIISKYEANNIDVIPISELKGCLSKGIEKISQQDSFTSHLIGELN